MGSPRCATYRGDNLRGVQHTAEKISVHTTEMISTVCNTPQGRSRQNVAHPGDHLRGVQHTSESRAPNVEKISWVCNPLWRQSRWCAAHRGDDLSGVQLTAETNSTLQVKIFTCLWLRLKGQLVEILLGVNTSIMKEKILSIKF